MTKYLLALTVILSVLATVEKANASNLIVNGGFESPDITGYYQPYDTGSTAITGWLVTGDSVELINSYWQGNPGQSIDLNGATTGGLAQSFSTTPGETYQVLFDMSGHFTGGSSIKHLTVSAGRTSYSFAFEIFTGWSVNNMGWTSKGFTFTADDTLTTLSIESDDTGYYGPAIDNVSVVPIPEPSSIMLCTLAFTALGFRRKK